MLKKELDLENLNPASCQHGRNVDIDPENSDPQNLKLIAYLHQK